MPAWAGLGTGGTRMSQSCCLRWPRHVLVHPPIRAFTGSDSRTGPAHSPPCPKARTPAPGHEHRQSAQPGCPGAGRRSGADLERGCREAMASKSRLEEASPGCTPSPGKGNPGLWALGWSGPRGPEQAACALWRTGQLRRAGQWRPEPGGRQGQRRAGHWLLQRRGPSAPQN